MKTQSVSPNQPTEKKALNAAGKAALTLGVGLAAVNSKMKKLPVSQIENLPYAFLAKLDKDSFIQVGVDVIEKGNEILAKSGHKVPQGAPKELAEKAYERTLSTFKTTQKTLAKTFAVAAISTVAAIKGVSIIANKIKENKANKENQ